MDSFLFIAVIMSLEVLHYYLKGLGLWSLVHYSIHVHFQLFPRGPKFSFIYPLIEFRSFNIVFRVKHQHFISSGFSSPSSSSCFLTVDILRFPLNIHRNRKCKCFERADFIFQLLLWFKYLFTIHLSQNRISPDIMFFVILCFENICFLLPMFLKLQKRMWTFFSSIILRVN